MHINLIPVNSSGLDKLNEEINIEQTLSIHTYLIGFCPLNTASGLTKRRSLPFGSFQEVTQAPKVYTSA